jgi:TonB-linked SusC/RagA family outer membrane protein
MKKVLQFFLMCVFAMSTMSLYAQERAVTGRVTSSDDSQPLPGVNVVLKGTSTGAVTDSDGSYRLNVPAQGGILVFSFIGLETQEIEVGTRTIVDVQMASDITQLSEVVVTSLGMPKEQKALGYSVQQVNSSELLKARETNIINSLSGKIAGVNITSSSGAVGASSRIVIRGANSFGNNQPLFVVDGVPISNNNFGGTANEGVNRGNAAADVNPDDVESVTVLKGPNAAALYGSRASNGVILITTKSGKKGQGLGIQFSTNMTFETPLKLPDYQNEYGQGSNGEFEYFDGKGGGINDGTDESWGPKLDAGLMIPQFNSPVSNGVRQATPWVSNPNNIKDFFVTGRTVTNNLSITGGNDKAGVRLSITDQRQKGMVPNTDQNKSTFSLNGNVALTDQFSINATGNYVKTKSDNLPGYGYSSQNVMQQFIWFGRQVDMHALKKYENDDGSKNGWNYNYHNNPYFTVNENLNTVDRDRVYGNLRATYKFTDWLSAFVRTGTDYYTNTNTGKVAASDIDTPSGSYTETTSSFSEVNSDFLVSFNKPVGESFQLALNVGGNRMNQKTHEIKGTAAELAIPGVYTLSNSKVPLTTSSDYRLKRINSVYFSGQVGYLGSLFLDFTGRNDWSSTLPKENNSYFYPSVSLSGVLTDLFKIESRFFSFAKVRASWAQVGSDTDPYQLAGTVSIGTGWNDATKLPSLLVPDNIPNAELKPQFTTSTEFGIDFRFLESRLRMDITYYDAKTTDQIISVPVSSSSGYTSKNINAGEIRNKGIELMLGGTVVKSGGGFEWDLTVNYAKNKNEVVALAPGVDSYVLGTYWALQVAAIPGERFGSLFGYGFKRDPDGNVIHANGLPQRDGTPRVLGSFTPDWTGGLMNEFRYKGIQLSVLVDMKWGGDLYSMTTTWGRYAGVLEETLIGRETGIIGAGVIDNGDGTFRANDVVVSAEQYNKAAFVNTLAEPSIFDASFAKLREIRLGYTLPNTVLGKLPIRDINISFVGRNLALLYSKVPHIDPETAFSNSNVQGLEFGQLPSTKSMGFNVTFKLQ